MSRNWTQQQLNAITATDGSILVSAAAGSGKTAVLVERVIRLITRDDNPLDVDRLLIVTFTRAAAREMRERIRAAITEKLEKDPYNSHLLNQRRLLYSANISTIDSFCSDLVREYFHSLGISRDFRIADDGELKILSAQALDNALEVFYNGKDTNFPKLLDAFAEKNGDAKLRQTVLKISEFLSTQPFPDKWLDDMLDNYSEKNIAESVWGKIIIDFAHTAVQHALNLTENSLNRVQEDEKLSEKFTPILENDRNYFSNVQKKLFGSSWNEIRDAVMNFEAKRLVAPRGYKDDPIKLAVAANRDEAKDTVNRLRSFFEWDEQTAYDEMSELYVLVSVLFSLVREYLSQFNELKTKKNILSFADIELLTVKLLVIPDKDHGYKKTSQACEVSKRFDAVMVDEFQDVNDVQDIIFKAVSNDEKNLFVVGDVKQSIYGFRQAKPEIFIERKEEYKRFNSENPEYPATIILDRNFRSRLEVCDTVNFIFSRLMTKDSAGMDYNDDEKLVNGAQYPKSESCNFEISLINEDESQKEPEETEAHYIANKILSMIKSGFTVKDGDSVRNAEYGDFAVILRSTKGRAVTYVNVLQSYGIPASSENKSSFFDALEIKLMLNLLRVIDNPGIDIPLLSVLCSPVYAFSPDELSEMRADSRKENLYTSVCRYADKNSKAAAFVKQLKKFRDYSCTCSVDELISKVCETTGILSVILAVNGNASSVKNIELLRVYARNFEKNGCKTLSDFISFIDKLIENNANLDASSQSEGENTNQVKVLSIHSSKGLEFPVCFIAGISHRFNKRDLTENILIDSKAGLGVKMRQNHIVYNTFPRLATSLQLEENLTAEEMRVLYVALTRAKEKLFAVGVVKDADSYLQKLYSKLVFESIIEPFTVTNCNSYCDWLCLCALVHPSLNGLRTKIMSGAKHLPSNGECPWTLNVVKNYFDDEDKNLFEDDIKSEELLQITDISSVDSISDYAQILQKNLEFKYKNSEILNLPQKVSASEIAHRQSSDYFEKILAKPSFIAAVDSVPAERGTAHHRFLQYCNFKAARKDFNSELDRLIKEGRLTAEQADLIDRKMLVEFISSPLADRIINSPLVMREKRFTARLAPSVVFDEYKDVKTDATVIMQGAVDLAFVENGKLVIVDYKTDRVKDIEKLSNLYAKQLYLYKAAMEQSEEMQVSECILCSIHLGTYVSV